MWLGNLNASIQEAEAGRPLRVLRQPGLCRDPVSLKTNKQNNNKRTLTVFLCVSEGMCMTEHVPGGWIRHAYSPQGGSPQQTPKYKYYQSPTW